MEQKKGNGAYSVVKEMGNKYLISLFLFLMYMQLKIVREKNPECYKMGAWRWNLFWKLLRVRVSWRTGRQRRSMNPLDNG